MHFEYVISQHPPDLVHSLDKKLTRSGFGCSLFEKGLVPFQLFLDNTNFDIWFIKDQHGNVFSVDPYAVISYLKFDSLVRRKRWGPIPLGYQDFANIFNAHPESGSKFVTFDPDFNRWVLPSPAASGPSGIRIQDAYKKTDPHIYDQLKNLRLILPDGTLDEERLSIMEQRFYSSQYYPDDGSRPHKKPRHEPYPTRGNKKGNGRPRPLVL
ncbi:hypothetical protein BDQ17DRAFT_1522870 [Cyathus striatus]|nr:hypothetical protein BDQ17DRAFT_1522870 [Cyathus striatus]